MNPLDKTATYAPALRVFPIISLIPVTTLNRMGVIREEGFFKARQHSSGQLIFLCGWNHNIAPEYLSSWSDPWIFYPNSPIGVIFSQLQTQHYTRFHFFDIIFLTDQSFKPGTSFGFPIKLFFSVFFRVKDIWIHLEKIRPAWFCHSQRIFLFSVPSLAPWWMPTVATGHEPARISRLICHSLFSSCILVTLAFNHLLCQFFWGSFLACKILKF